MMEFIFWDFRVFGDVSVWWIWVALRGKIWEAHNFHCRLRATIEISCVNDVWHEHFAVVVFVWTICVMSLCLCVMLLHRCARGPDADPAWGLVEREMCINSAGTQIHPSAGRPPETDNAVGQREQKHDITSYIRHKYRCVFEWFQLLVL